MTEFPTDPMSLPTTPDLTTPTETASGETGDNAERFPGSHWVLPTDIDLVEDIAEAFTKKLEEAGLDKDSDEVYYLGIAFREALINAIAHGNLGVEMPDGSTRTLGELAKEKQTRNPTDKKVYVDVEIDAGKISVTIRDEGRGFNWRKIPDPKVGDAVLKSKGRGVMFMRSFFDSATYNESGNEVTMVKSR